MGDLTDLKSSSSDERTDEEESDPDDGSDFVVRWVFDVAVSFGNEEAN